MGSQLDKAKDRLKSEPSDYTFTEAQSLLSRLGFTECSKGRTSGSRIMFVRDGVKICLHKPHPGNVMKGYAVSQLKDQLVLLGDL